MGQSRSPVTELLDRLPPMLPIETIRAFNMPRVDLLNITREYSWNGFDFEVPPGVCLPGLTSKMIFDRVFDGSIEVRDRRYLVMGCGLGVETIAAAERGAAVVYAVDVHEASVRATEEHFGRFIADRIATDLVPVVADMFDGVPDGIRADVVTFNPPAVRIRISEDADVVRNICVGAPLLARFFAGLGEREILAPDGEVFVVMSNTAEMRVILEDAIANGFHPELVYLHDWKDGLLTHLFRFTGGDLD